MQSGDRAMILCFVEFDDAKYAFTAMEALQGEIYDGKFDDLRAIFSRKRKKYLTILQFITYQLQFFGITNLLNIWFVINLYNEFDGFQSILTHVV